MCDYNGWLRGGGDVQGEREGRGCLSRAVLVGGRGEGEGEDGGLMDVYCLLGF